MFDLVSGVASFYFLLLYLDYSRLCSTLVLRGQASPISTSAKLLTLCLCSVPSVPSYHTRIYFPRGEWLKPGVGVGAGAGAGAGVSALNQEQELVFQNQECICIRIAATENISRYELHDSEPVWSGRQFCYTKPLSIRNNWWFKGPIINIIDLHEWDTYSSSSWS